VAAPRLLIVLWPAVTVARCHCGPLSLRPHLTAVALQYFVSVLCEVLSNLDLFGNWADVFKMVGMNEHPTMVVWGRCDEVCLCVGVSVCQCVCVSVCRVRLV
jgi:hypothetical protein